MSKGNSEKSGEKIKLKMVKVKVEAIDDGYYKGVIIKTGKKFTYEGPLKNGKLPLWVKSLEEVNSSKEVNSIL